MGEWGKLSMLAIPGSVLHGKPTFTTFGASTFAFDYVSESKLQSLLEF